MEKRNIRGRRDYLKVGAAAVAGLAIGAAAGYGSYPAVNPPPKPVEKPTVQSFLQGSTLNISFDSRVEMIDPHRITTPAAYCVADNTFDKLIEFDQGSLNLESGLAYSSDLSDDGKELTFYLWKGVKFHDGTELKASDVKFSFERLLNPETKALYYAYLSWIDKIDVIDDYTVKFVAKEPTPTAFVSMATVCSVVMNEKRLNELGGDISTDISGLGSGPFKFVEWKPNERVTLEANENYWRGRPLLDNLVVRDIPEATTRGVAVQTGEIDVGYTIPYDLVEKMKTERSRDFTFADDRKPGSGWIGFNCSRPPFADNLNLRRACAYAIRYNDVLAIYKGHAQKPAGPYLPSALWGYPEDVKGYDYNPDEAKRLLTDAGYPQGLDITIHTADWMMQEAQVCAASLTEIGINAKIIHLDDASFFAACEQGTETQAFMTSWGVDIPDPDNILYIPFRSGSGMNFSHWKNDRYDELVDKGRTIMNQDERAILYEEAYKLLVDQVPVVFIRDLVLNWVISKNVHNLRYGPHFQYFMRDVWKK